MGIYGSHVIRYNNHVTWCCYRDEEAQMKMTATQQTVKKWNSQERMLRKMKRAMMMMTLTEPGSGVYNSDTLPLSLILIIICIF